MLSIEVCKNTLNKNKKKYSNEQVKLVRDYLYKMAQVLEELNYK